MQLIRTILWRFLKEERGATLVEYGFMVSLIAIAAFGATVTFGSALQTLYQHIVDDIVVALN